MPTPKSPYAQSFNSAIKRGVPAGQAVEGIAKRQNKPQSQIFNSLHKAGLCERQKLNGQWVYWTSEKQRTNATHAKASQVQMWQNFIDWAIASGHCKPEQLTNNTGSQKDFMNYCKKYFSRQVGTASSSSSSRKSSSRKRSTSATAKKRTGSTTARKRTSSTTARKRTTSTTARKRTTARKSTTRATSYKFPRATASSSRSRTRRAA